MRVCSYETGQTAKINKYERAEQLAGEVPGPRRSSHTLLLYFLVQVLHQALSGRWERNWAGTGWGQGAALMGWGGAKNNQQMRGLESNTQDWLRLSWYVTLCFSNCRLLISDWAVSQDMLPTFCCLTVHKRIPFFTLAVNFLLLY